LNDLDTIAVDKFYGNICKVIEVVISLGSDAVLTFEIRVINASERFTK